MCQHDCFLHMSRTLSCKSHKCVTMTVFAYVKNSFLQIIQMCHHDCFCVCQELFPANHTNVSTPGLFLQMSQTISCKSYRCVKTMSVLTNDRSSFLQIRCIKFDMEKEFQLLTYFSRSVSTLLVCCHKSNPLKQDFCTTTIPVNTTKQTYSPKTYDNTVQ